MDVKKRIIALREQCGLTQNGLAERAGVSQTHLRRVELGQADITIGHLELLCDAMSISIQDFFKELINNIGFITITLIGCLLVVEDKISLGTLFTFSSLIS